MLLFLRQMFMMHVCLCVCVYVCVCVCVCFVVVHWHCSAQLSMFNVEKCYRNKIIIIIISAAKLRTTGICALVICFFSDESGVPDQAHLWQYDQPEADGL